jgi:hypothetical protein
MTRLDNYRLAILAVRPEVSDKELKKVLDEKGPEFPHFIVAHGLGALWHERTGQMEFRASRRSAEALYIAQAHALAEIDLILETAGIEYAVIKGAANRLLLYENPAIRACYDLDILVLREDAVRTASLLAQAGFKPRLSTHNISHELLLSRNLIDIDLHWGLLREGRLRPELTVEMLRHRRRSDGIWMLSTEDALFVLLVHPAFAKHLAGWQMGLHRVMDIVEFVHTQSFDWQMVSERLTNSGVRTAAWATLRWVDLLTGSEGRSDQAHLLSELCPSRVRRAWLDRWMRMDFSERTSSKHWARLLGFSLFLHDEPRDVLRALVGRYRAYRRRRDDAWAFREIIKQ